MHSVLARVRNENGSALFLGGVTLALALGMAALAVDIAALYSARSEAQNAADAAALAGVSAFVDGTGLTTASTARARAVETGTENSILGRLMEPAEFTVTVDELKSLVRVTVRREVATYFARIIGVPVVPVSARAAAEAGEVSTMSCVKPWSPPDPSAIPTAGAGVYKYGQQLTVVGTASSWQGVPWVLPITSGWSGPCTDQGAMDTPPAYRADICNCNRTMIDTKITYRRPSGASGGLAPHTGTGTANLIAQDPTAYWDAMRGQVARSKVTNWRSSPRVVTVPLHDPTYTGKDLRFTRFAKVFVESESNGVVTGRFVGNVRTARLTE
jgi:hypothetical protein